MPTKTITITVHASSLADRVLDSFQGRVFSALDCADFIQAQPRDVATTLACLRKRGLARPLRSRESVIAGMLFGDAPFDSQRWALHRCMRRGSEGGRVQWTAEVDE